MFAAAITVDKISMMIKLSSLRKGKVTSVALEIVVIIIYVRFDRKFGCKLLFAKWACAVDLNLSIEFLLRNTLCLRFSFRASRDETVCN